MSAYKCLSIVTAKLEMNVFEISHGGESIHPTVLLSKLLRITRNYLQVMGGD